jgi:hypothetical protein
MKGAICGLVASTLLMAWGGGGEAWAQKKGRVVVEQFPGNAGDKFRQVVIATITRQGYEVVPERQVASAEADLGLLQVSDNYPTAAKELKAVAFVTGSMATSKKKVGARLRIRGADGQTLGADGWTAPNLAKLSAQLKSNLGQKIKEWMAGAGPAPSGGGGGPVAAAKEEEPAPEPPKANGRKRAAAARAEEVAAAKEEEAPAAAEAEGDDEKVASKAADEEVAEEVEEEDEPTGRKGDNWIDVGIGAHVYSRNFRYNESWQGGHQEYRLPAVPAPALSLDIFPHKYFGFGINAEYSVALISEDAMKNRYRTGSFGYGVSGKVRYSLGPVGLIGGVGYAANNFKITPETDDTTPPRVAGVDYKQLRAGVAARIPITDKFAIIGGGNYLHLLSMGEIASDKYFPRATGMGGEGFGGIALALPWMAGLEGRAMLDFRRYVFSMNSDPGDMHVAGGAVDQYIGVNIGFGLRK